MVPRYRTGCRPPRQSGGIGAGALEQPPRGGAGDTGPARLPAPYICNMLIPVVTVPTNNMGFGFFRVRFLPLDRTINIPLAATFETTGFTFPLTANRGVIGGTVDEKCLAAHGAFFLDTDKLTTCGTQATRTPAHRTAYLTVIWPHVRHREKLATFKTLDFWHQQIPDPHGAVPATGKLNTTSAANKKDTATNMPAGTTQ